MAQTPEAKKFAVFLQSIGVDGDKLPAWEREMGFSKDSIRKFLEGKTHAIGSDRLKIIGRRYPSLNFNWLLRDGDHTPGDALCVLDKMEKEMRSLRHILVTLEQ